jgi:catechol-2,3-dioxygenase
MIKRFAAVALWVEDFTSVLHFYQDILGLDLISHHGDVPQLKVGNGILVLVKGKLPPAIDAFPAEFPLITFEVNDLNKMADTLMAENVELKSGIEERRGSRWIRVSDPAGNMIELVEIKR